MELNLIVESKNFDHDKSIKEQLDKNPCSLCMFLSGNGMICVDRKSCRWFTHREIFIKKEVKLPIQE